MSVGRNDPCPCGSGKKYKYCCLEKQNSPFSPDPEDFEQLLKGGEFDSMEEMQAFVNQFMNMENASPIDDFDGLSSDQVHQLLYSPLDSPDCATFFNVQEKDLKAPVMTLFSMLFEAMGEKGLKATAKGNLPRQFCRDKAAIFWAEQGEDSFFEPEKIRSEVEFSEMHYLRIVAELAELVGKEKGKFVISKKCRTLLNEEGMAGIYRRLFIAYTQNFNWGYCDRYPEVHFFQQSFLYTLFLLQKYGGKMRHQRFYEDKFLQAFPSIESEMPETAYSDKQQIARDCYFHRSFYLFARFFGLAELTKDDEKDPRRWVAYLITKRPLLDKLITFHC